MSERAPQTNGIPCAACLAPIATRDKSGEVRLSISVKPGIAIALTAPICEACASRTRNSPEGALAVLRSACPAALGRRDAIVG